MFAYVCAFVYIHSHTVMYNIISYLFLLYYYYLFLLKKKNNFNIYFYLFIV